MVLEETLYHPTMSEDQQGIDAWKRMPVESLLGKRSRDDEPVANPARKLRRTMSARLGSQNQGLWTDIVGGGFADQPIEDRQWEDVDRAMRPPLRNARSLVMEPKSFASETTTTDQRESLPVETGPPTPPEDVAKSHGFLHGKSFYLHGFTARQVRPYRGLRWVMLIHGVDLDIRGTHYISRRPSCSIVIQSFPPGTL